MVNDASIKQTTITLTYDYTLSGASGYLFTSGIPFAGYIIMPLPCWIGIYKQNSMYYIFGFYASTVRGGGVIEDFYLINNGKATIFYI